MPTSVPCVPRPTLGPCPCSSVAAVSKQVYAIWWMADPLKGAIDRVRRGPFVTDQCKGAGRPHSCLQ
jgi:hypothetical protein